MADELDKIQEKHKQMTFRAATEECLQSKRNVLSPATVRGYKSIMGTLSDGFLDKNIHDITAMDIQSEIIIAYLITSAIYIKNETRIILHF